MFYILAWFSFCIGYIFTKKEYTLSNKLEKFTWNSRIDAHQKFPFSHIYKLGENNDYILLAILVISINLTMVLIQYISGIILISPMILIYQGFITGSLISQADKKTKYYSYIVLIFEIGAYSTAGAISFHLGLTWLLWNGNLSKELINITENLYFYLPLILLILNGIFESWSVSKGIQGIPGKKAIKHKKYK
ncbi:MAG: stage II sporulation protein M [Candidatus Thermoplasmatota archaeon]